MLTASVHGNDTGVTVDAEGPECVGVVAAARAGRGGVGGIVVGGVRGRGDGGLGRGDGGRRLSAARRSRCNCSFAALIGCEIRRRVINPRQFVFFFFVGTMIHRQQNEMRMCGNRIARREKATEAISRMPGRV